MAALGRRERHGHLRPFVYGITLELDPVTLRPSYVPDTSTIYPIYFFVEGTPYNCGACSSPIGTASVRASGRIRGISSVPHVGTDRLGRDMCSRVVYGARISLSIGLVGVIFSLVLGVLLGGISGYYGGSIDISSSGHRISALACPPFRCGWGWAPPCRPHWPPERVYFGITIILSLLGWTGLARVVRGRFSPCARKTS